MRKTLSLTAAAVVIATGAIIGIVEYKSGPVTTVKTDRIAGNSFLTERFAG